jgi:hypothetical protein
MASDDSAEQIIDDVRVFFCKPMDITNVRQSM